MTKSSQVTKSALIIIIFTLGSKFLGFIREVLIASKFGSGMLTDTFFVTMTGITLITGFLSNAISTTSIPILSEIENKEGKERKVKHVNNMINITFLISIILVLIGLIASPIIVKLLARGFEGDQFNLAVELTRIGLPMILFGGITGVFIGYLQSEQRFASAAAIGFPFNIVYIFFLLFMSSKYGIRGLMISAVIAVLSQFLIQIPSVIKLGYKYMLVFDLKDKYIKKIILLSIPVLIGVAIDDLNAIVDRTLASSLVDGSISSLNYAHKLNGLILGVFISAITTVIFPLLSKECNQDNIIGMKKIMSYGVNLILIITVPATVILIVLSTPIVEIAFQRGEFDSIATVMTSKALIFYSIGLTSMSLRLLVIRVFYSLQDTKTPMINGAISVTINIILNIILVKFMNHSGLALATSISVTISIIFLFYNLKRKIGSLEIKAHIVTFFKTILASVSMGITSYLIYNLLESYLASPKLFNLIFLVISVIIGIGVYVLICYMLHIEEIEVIIKKIKAKLIHN